MKKARHAIPNQRLIEERTCRHWSQQEVAEHIGTTPVNISRWERGITSPGPYFRNQICTIFEKDAVELGLLADPADMQEMASLNLESKDIYTTSIQEGHISDSNEQLPVPPSVPESPLPPLSYQHGKIRLAITWFIRPWVSPMIFTLVLLVIGASVWTIQSSTPIRAFQAGMLYCFVTAPTTTVNLTNEGTTDWIHWGSTSSTSVDQKQNVASGITFLSILNGGTVTRYTNNPTIYTWMDGTPTHYMGRSPTGVYLKQLASGFHIIVHADAVTRLLRVYIGGNDAQGQLQARMDDTNIPVETALVPSLGTSSGNYVFTCLYRASISAGQALTINYTLQQIIGAESNISIQAATLTVP